MFAVSGRFTERGIAQKAKAVQDRIHADREEARKRRAEEQAAAIRELREQHIEGEFRTIVINEPSTVRPLVRDIIAQVAKRHRISPRDITGPRRNKKYIAARVEAIRIAADTRPDMSLTELGRIFQRDHSTIIHALNKTKTEGQAR